MSGLCGAGDQIQGFVHAGQALYQLSSVCCPEGLAMVTMEEHRRSLPPQPLLYPRWPPGTPPVVIRNAAGAVFSREASKSGQWGHLKTSLLGSTHTAPTPGVYSTD